MVIIVYTNRIVSNFFLEDNAIKVMQISGIKSLTKLANNADDISTQYQAARLWANLTSSGSVLV